MHYEAVLDAQRAGLYRDDQARGVGVLLRAADASLEMRLAGFMLSPPWR